MKLAGLILGLAMGAAWAQSPQVMDMFTHLTEQRLTLSPDRVVTDYVNRIAEKLGTAAALKTAVSVKIFVGSDTDAITMGANHLYLSDKLILAAVNESELAGVIAHQIGHLMLPRPAEILAVTIPVLSEGGLCFRRSELLFGLPLRFLAEQGKVEAKADLLGLKHANAAGYDAGGLADFYERALKGYAAKATPFNSWLVFPAATRVKADAFRAKGRGVITTSEFVEMQGKLRQNTAR